MGLIWRRRSSVFKIVIALVALWFTIIFFTYSDDRSSSSNSLFSQPEKLVQKVVDKRFNRYESEKSNYVNDIESFKKEFQDKSFKDAHIDKVVNVEKNDVDEYENKDADENNIINGNEIVNGEDDAPVVVEAKDKITTSTTKKRPSKKRGQAAVNNDNTGVLVPPNDLGIESPGELGKPVVLPSNMSADMKKAVDEGWLKNAFNQYVSDMISVKRSLPDPRTKYCKENVHYLEDLPSTAVIVCFHNEAWSVLLRTVHSILDRSPEHLLDEIILVDDFSDMPHTQKQLEDYMANYPKVKIIRAEKREGLIRARLLGAKAATAPVLTFLDSHCECTTGWLEPLLDRIARNSSTVVCPVIDVIDDTTLQYHYHDSSGVQVGGFDWNLQFNWHPVPEWEKKKHKDNSEPVWSPTMAGGLFSIDAKFFKRLGMYDPDFDIWGGENLELSFKTWMCGGTLEIIPCSHVGHIFRKRSPYKWRSGVNVLRRNSIRLAEVWMDDYAKYYYQRIGNDKGDFGDISDRVNLRKDLKCHSFQWYLDTIYPELFIPGDAVAQGEVRNGGFGNRTCLDAPSGKRNLKKPVGLYPCHAQGGNQIRNNASGICVDSPVKPDDMQGPPVSVWPCHNQGGNQYWMLSKTGEIRRDEACLDFAGQDVILYPCHGGKGNQFWTYRQNTKQLHHRSSDRCLAIDSSKSKLLMEECNPVKESQKWLFENYDASKLVKSN